MLITIIKDKDYLPMDLHPNHFDLISPDGRITSLKDSKATLTIEGISPFFVGFDIDQSRISFNLKSSLAQVGVDSRMTHLIFDKAHGRAEIEIELFPLSKMGKEMLTLLKKGALIGKLFAADDRRRVHDPRYLSRMFKRSDRFGAPLLSLGGPEGSSSMVLERVDNVAIAYLSVLEGVISYESTIEGFLPTMAKALMHKISIRDFLQLHQRFIPDEPRLLKENHLLLIKTPPLHVRTVFARVAKELLPKGYIHTSADILQPDTKASGDIYELYGTSPLELSEIPLEFYTLEPYREYIFFADRDQLQTCLDSSADLFAAFDTAPESQSSVFIVKGSQLKSLKTDDWLVRDPHKHDFPGISHSERQGLLAEKYIHQQPTYPFLKAITEGVITSQGVLFCRYFPSPLLKSALLNEAVIRCVKGLYFRYPSLSHEDFFSHEDFALLNDLSKFGIPVFWIEKRHGKILQFIQKNPGESGMFVPLDMIKKFKESVMFGIYGSNLLEGNFEQELISFFKELQAAQKNNNWPLLDKNKPLALITGGGPGAMEVGNRVAKLLGILSCANIVDFRAKDKKNIINEQRQNSYVEAKMTYRIEKLVERQAEFNLDYPIFLTGGIGTDFEYALEELRRKVGTVSAKPVLLFGAPSYWRSKITYRFQSNLQSGTIKGSEWISNCFYVVENAKEAFQVFEAFFSGKLLIGKAGPVYDEGFVVASYLFHTPLAPTDAS